MNYLSHILGLDPKPEIDKLYEEAVKLGYTKAKVTVFDFNSLKDAGRGLADWRLELTEFINKHQPMTTTMNNKINTVGITSYDDVDTCYRNLWPEPDAGASFYETPAKEMSDIYYHLKGKLNFHETAKDGHQDYHRKEASDIRIMIRAIDLVYGRINLNDGD